MRFWNWLNDRIVVCAWGIAAAILTVGLLVAICRLGFVHVVTGKWVTSAGALRDVALTLAAVIGFPIVIQRARSHDKQATAAREQAEANRKQAETDSRRRLAEAYSKAADLFSKAELPLRLAGLYALWKIAEEDPENHHIQIMQILCAFVRHPMPLENWEPIEAVLTTTIRPDLEAVMNLLGKRNENQREQESAVEYKMDFKGADLQNFDLRGGDWRLASFIVADLRGVEFDISDMWGAQFASANLGRTSFHSVDLRQASFFYAEVDERTIFDDAAMNGASLLDGIRGDLSCLENGVMLTKDGEVMHSEESSQEKKYTAGMRRMDIQEWKEKRRHIYNAIAIPPKQQA